MKILFFSLPLLSLLLAFLPQSTQAQNEESNTTPAEASNGRHRGDLVPIEYRHRGDLVPIEYKSRGDEERQRARSFGVPPTSAIPSSDTTNIAPDQEAKPAKDLPELKQANIFSLEKVQIAPANAEQKLENLSLKHTRLVVHFKPGVELQQGTDALQKLITQGALILDEEFYDNTSKQYGIVLKCTNLDYALPAAQALFDEHEVQRVELKNLKAKANEKSKADGNR